MKQTEEKNRKMREQQAAARQHNQGASQSYNAPQTTSSPAQYNYPPKNVYSPPLPQSSSATYVAPIGGSSTPAAYMPQSSSAAYKAPSGGSSTQAPGYKTTPSAKAVPDYGSDAPPASSGNGGWVEDSPAYATEATFKAQILNGTNTYRQMYQAQPLEWDDTLAEFGNTHASKCLFDHTVSFAFPPVPDVTLLTDDLI